MYQFWAMPSWFRARRQWKRWENFKTDIFSIFYSSFLRCALATMIKGFELRDEEKYNLKRRNRRQKKWKAKELQKETATKWNKHEITKWNTHPNLNTHSEQRKRAKKDERWGYEAATRWIKWRDESTQLECCTQTNAIISRERFFSFSFIPSDSFNILSTVLPLLFFIRFASRNIKIISCILSFNVQLFVHYATLCSTVFLSMLFVPSFISFGQAFYMIVKMPLKLHFLFEPTTTIKQEEIRIITF